VKGKQYSAPEYRFWKVSDPQQLILVLFAKFSEADRPQFLLLGRHLLDGSAIIVDAVTAPMAGDRRTRTRFHRAQRRHQAAIDAAWATSDGTCTYLRSLKHQNRCR
jgi:hypothetical protein